MDLPSRFSLSLTLTILPVFFATGCFCAVHSLENRSSIRKPVVPTDKGVQKAKYHLEQSIRLEDRRKLRSALLEMNRAVNLSPRTISFRIRRADLLEQLGMYQEATREYHRALNIVPEGKTNSGKNHFYRGQAFYNLLRFEEAYSEAEKAIKAGFKSHKAYRLLGKITFKQERYKESISHLKKAVAVKPSSTSYYYLSACHKALGEFSKALFWVDTAERNGLGSSNLHFQKALLLYRLKRIDEARKQYLAWKSQRPLDIVLYPDWKSFVIFCETDQKIDYYGKLFVLSGKKDANALYERAILRFSLARYQRAAEEMEAYLEMTGWNGHGGVSAACYAHIGYLLAGRTHRASSILEKAGSRLKKRVWPYPVYLFLRGSLTAKQLISRETLNKQQLTVFYYFLGLKQMQSGKNREALASYKKVLDLKRQGLDEFELARAEYRRLKQRISLSTRP